MSLMFAATIGILVAIGCLASIILSLTMYAAKDSGGSKPSVKNRKEINKKTAVTLRQLFTKPIVWAILICVTTISGIAGYYNSPAVLFIFLVSAPIFGVLGVKGVREISG